MSRKKLSDNKIQLRAATDQVRTFRSTTDHDFAAMTDPIEVFPTRNGGHDAWSTFRPTNPVLEHEQFARLPASLRTVSFEEPV